MSTNNSKGAMVNQVARQLAAEGLGWCGKVFISDVCERIADGSMFFTPEDVKAMLPGLAAEVLLAGADIVSELPADKAAKSKIVQGERVRYFVTLL